MPINENLIQTHIQNRHGYGQQVMHHAVTRQQLSFTLTDSKQQLERKSVELMLPYILWNDLWNRFGTFGTKRNQPRNNFAQRKYSRGRKVFVDFGYNIGREASMSHPAIVVANFKDFLIVAPHTGDDGKPFPKDVEKVIIKCPSDGNIFNKDTVIELHQLRCIAKNRVIKDLGVSVQDYTLPNNVVDQLNMGFPSPILPYQVNLEKAIEMKIAYHYAPDVFHQVVNLTQQNEALKEENQHLREQLKTIQQPFLKVAAGRENGKIGENY